MLASACKTLLCWYVWRLLICLFVQHASRHRNVFNNFNFNKIILKLDKLHSGEMSCFN